MDTTITQTSASRGELLRNVLVADGVVCATTGLLLAIVAGPLNDVLGLPTSLLRGVGLFLIPFGALVFLLGTRPAPARTAVQVLIAGNLLWVAASVALLVSGRVDPTGLGIAFVLLQAILVAAFAEFQILGLRRRG